MSELNLTLFGSFEGFLDGQPLPPFRTAKVQALLIYLVAEQAPQRREHLMELLWPGMPERSARHNLRQVLYYLKGAIPDLSPRQAGGESAVPPVLTNRQTIQLNPEAAVAADIHQFAALKEAVQAHDHLALVSCPDCRRSLEQAAAAYRGDFLADFYLDDSSAFEEWAQVRREAFRRHALDALEILTAMAIRRQDLVEGRTLAERQLEIDNLRESSCRQLMEVLALSGRREEALAVYETLRRLLAEELAMEPASRTTGIYEQILAGELQFDTQQTSGVRGFDIKEEIGVGTYGVIHRAVQSAVQREVAVKVIRRRYANNPEFIRRFEDEAQMVARLEHPHIVPLYDYWRDPDGAYLVMRYLKGGSLLDALAGGPWAPAAAGTLLEEIGGALAHAHHLGVVHRDIKPANILLDEAGRAYLSDFGIAREPGQNAGRRLDGGQVITADYISPEQILNEPIGPQSDIYSLGAVLFEVLTGEKPFGEGPVANRLFRHLHEPIPLVQESRPGVPPAVDAAIQKATAKRPAERYADALEFAAAFRRALDGGDPAGIQPAGRRPAGPVTNPYKGLEAFQEADAENFYGREALVERLIVRLLPAPAHPARGGGHPATARCLTLVGPSGSGKSSVVKAGLLPALRQEAVPGSDRWFVAEMVPGTHPLEELEMALWPIAVDPPPSLVEPMQRDKRGLLRTLRRILPGEEGGELLLVIDQFEELFTLVEDEARRTFFIDSLLAALTAPRSPLRVVITLRADFYDRPLQIPGLAQILKETTEVILPLTAEELLWAVREPARRVSVDLEEGLAAAIVADVADRPGALPLLQYALTELFEQRQDNRMTHTAYAALGGVRGALGRRGAEIYDALDPAGQAAARQLFLRLVTLGDGVEDTRRRVARAELEALAGAAGGPGNNAGQAAFGRPAIDRVLDDLGQARLLTFDRHPISHEPTVEVAHEALLREWPQLRRWLDDHRNEVRLQRRLARAAAEWLAAGRDGSYLLRGSRLAQFESWQDHETIALTGEERSFLEASLDARQARRAEEESRRQRELDAARQLADTEKARAAVEASSARRLRQRAFWLAGALLAALVFGLAAAGFGVASRRSAALAEERAFESQSRELAAAATLRLDSDPELGLMLAARALETYETVEAGQALHDALQAARVRQRLAGHEEAIQRVAYAPDGQLVALFAAGEDRATIWEAATGRLLHEIPTGRCCWGIYFDEKGERLAAVEAGETFSLAVWDTATGEQIASTPLPLAAREISPGGSFLSPDWSRAAFWLRGTTLSVWDLQAGEKLFDLPGHSGQVEVEFSRDGRRLVSTDNRGLVLAWDARTGEQLRRLEPRRFINDHAVSPDGRWAALAVNTESAGWEVHLWDLEADADAPAVRLAGHLDTIYLVTFSDDGRLVASASQDGTARIWDSRTGETLWVLPHGGHVRSVAFHPDGLSLLSSDLEGTARIWDITPEGAAGRLTWRANNGPSFAAALSPDGRRLATGGVPRLWDPATGALVRALDRRPGTVMAAVFHPDGRRLATAVSDATARIWDAETGEELLSLAGHGGSLIGGIQGVLDIAFAPDGERLATAGADGTARIWDVESGEMLAVLEGHTADLSAVAFSPDGRWLATVQASGEQLHVETAPTTVRLWAAGTGEPVFSFDAGHGIRAWGLAFSPDSRWLATSGTDRAVRLWTLDFEGGAAALAAALTGHTNVVFNVAFSPDGRLLASATADEVRLWDLAAFNGGADGSAIAERLVLPGGGGITFTPDGSELITAGRDGLVRAYPLEPADLLALARSRQTRGWTEADCRRFLHLESCPPEIDS